MNYPDNCIRGIKTPDLLYEDGTPSPEVFYFLGLDRGDGWKEESIDWQDNDHVVQHTLGQRRTDGNIRFRGGVVVLPRVEIDNLNNRPMFRGLLSYERKPLPENAFHGNILLKASTIKRTMKVISACLVGYVTDVIPQNSS